MEELNNRQIVLLTMFVSFVVSIATGIITVAMLEEAPPTITQTVNRVVEHTIERVVTGTTTEKIVQVPVTTVTKEQTQYQSEDDMVASAIEKNQKRLVEIWVDKATTSAPTDVGVLVSRDGVIAVDGEKFSSASAKDEVYMVRIGADFYRAEHIAPTSGDAGVPVVFLKILSLPPATVLDPVTFINKSARLGQTVVVVGNTNMVGIFKSSITRFSPVVLDGAASSTPNSFSKIVVVPAIPDDTHGSLVLNLDGQAVGIVVSDPELPGKDMICPVAYVLELLNTLSPQKSS